MARYHLNEKGEAKPCSARPGHCPLSPEGEHFTSVEAAEAFFSKTQATLPKISKGYTSGPIVHDFTEENYALAVEAVEKANKRLEKIGVAERFTYEDELYF